MARQQEARMEAEKVNHPTHYGGEGNTYEAIKVIEAWGLGFNLGNTVKYICRVEHKGAALADLEKAVPEPGNREAQSGRSADRGGRNLMQKCGCGKTISDNKLACRKCAETTPAKGGGVLEILNVQGGDIKITFDPNDVVETIRAKRMIEDMLRRGYTLVVEVERDGEKAYERVQKFDAARGEYIIADFDSQQAADVDKAAFASDAPGELRSEKRAKKETKTRAISMTTSMATAIGRSAGG